MKKKTIITLKKIIISCVNYRTLHVKQPDVSSCVRPETKPLLTRFQTKNCNYPHSLSDSDL